MENIYIRKDYHFLPRQAKEKILFQIACADCSHNPFVDFSFQIKITQPIALAKAEIMMRERQIAKDCHTSEDLKKLKIAREALAQLEECLKIYENLKAELK